MQSTSDKSRESEQTLRRPSQVEVRVNKALSHFCVTYTVTSPSWPQPYGDFLLLCSTEAVLIGDAAGRHFRPSYGKRTN